MPSLDPVKNGSFSIHRLARVGSTQDVVKGAAARGAPAWYCCVAVEQTQGRGRQGRSWEAPPGTALLASVLLRLPRDQLEGLPFAAALAVADAVLHLTGLPVRLKWPNDVMARERKLAGLLIEIVPARGEPASQASAVVGLGFNLTVPAFPPAVRGISLHELVAPAPARDDLLLAWLHALQVRLDDLSIAGPAATIAAWKQRATGLGGRVKLVHDSRPLEATAVDVGDDGALLLRRDDDSIVRVFAGDVHLISMRRRETHEAAGTAPAYVPAADAPETRRLSR